ncbi:transposase [Streptosporangium canum]|uniref:helix-turn-helix domain-containing protein n=1 Tax=Streptosporangium canum TaxID=324952 RepID=UPI0036774137
MPARSVLAASERRRLKKLAYSRPAPYQQVVRIRIVLDAAHGYANARIALRRQVHIDTVRTWRGRYADQGMDGLKDRPRSGRPPRFSPAQRAEVKALACQLPAETAAKAHAPHAGREPSRVCRCPDGPFAWSGAAPHAKSKSPPDHGDTHVECSPLLPSITTEQIGHSEPVAQI